MDEIVIRAAHALGRGRALEALSWVGRADDAMGLMLRGIAYAQMGDLELARTCLSRASNGTADPLLGARIRAAEVEIDLAAGDAAGAARRAAVVAGSLEALGDARNAAMQRIVQARAEVLRGRLGEARRTIEPLMADADLPEPVRAVAALALAEIAVRELSPTRARKALDALGALVDAAPNELLGREAKALEAELHRPIARLASAGMVRDVDLFAIESASAGRELLVDACRRTIGCGSAIVSLARRPVLFALASELARAWPEAVSRDDLICRAFGARRPNESHRARLRVEIGRLRRMLAGIAEPRPTGSGYVFDSPRPLAVLLPLRDDDAARVTTLLADGALWTAQRLAEHLGTSKRTVQRALADLVASGAAERVGAGADVAYTGTSGRVASRLLLLTLVSPP